MQDPLICHVDYGGIPARYGPVHCLRKRCAQGCGPGWVGIETVFTIDNALCHHHCAWDKGGVQSTRHAKADHAGAR
nr:hypothetical protein [Crenobacter sp. SG2305]